MSLRVLFCFFMAHLIKVDLSIPFHSKEKPKIEKRHFWFFGQPGTIGTGGKKSDVSR